MSQSPEHYDNEQPHIDKESTARRRWQGALLAGGLLVGVLLLFFFWKRIDPIPNKPPVITVAAEYTSSELPLWW